MTRAASGLGAALWRAYEYLAMVLGLGTLAVLCVGWLPFALLCTVLPTQLGRRIGRGAIMLIFRAYLRFLSLFCACRFELSALDSLRRDAPLILVANHPSLLDVVLIVSRLPNAVCVMKAALMDELLLGAAARLARYIRNDAPVSMVRGACAALQEGAHLLIFPEGSRTVHFPLDACTNAAGLIASRAGVPVQALILEYSSPYLGKAWPLLRKPSLPLHVRVRLGRRFEAPTQVRDFTCALEADLRRELAGDPPTPAPFPRRERSVP